MSKAAYWQRGEALDYPNNTTDVIEALTIVSLNSRIGVIGGDILPGEVGTVAVLGVFEMPKADPAAIEMGTEVYFDGNGITSVSGGTLAGYAAADAATDDSTVLVKLIG